MQKEIMSFVDKAREDFKNTSWDKADEATTKNGVILPLLRLLGWDPFNIDEVRPEYTVGATRVDYSLRLNDSNKVFIEAKRIREDLENHQEQLLNYSFKEGIELAILTNGVTWWFYLPLRKGNWEDRRFYSIDLIEQKSESVASRFCRYLSKEAIATGEALKNAETDYKSKQRNTILKKTLPKAWNKIISEADELLVDLIGETTETLCGYKADAKLVEDFLSGHRNELMISGLGKPFGGRWPPIGPKPSASVRRPSPRKPFPPREGRPDYTGKKPRAFVFKGKRYEVKTWKGVLIGLCEVIRRARPREFRKVLGLSSRFRPYFSKNASEFRASTEIGQTGIFANTNLNVNGILKHCGDVLKLFGYSPDDLEIEAD